jgi:hypothetical protein
MMDQVVIVKPIRINRNRAGKMINKIVTQAGLMKASIWRIRVMNYMSHQLRRSILEITKRLWMVLILKALGLLQRIKKDHTTKVLKVSL